MRLTLFQKIEPKSTYSFLVEKLNENLELRKEAKDTLTIDEFIAQYHTKFRSPFPKQQNINVISNNYNVYLVGGKTELLNSNGKLSRLLYVLADEKRPVKVSLLDEKMVIAEKNVAYPKTDFKAALNTSTRDNIQTVMLKKGQKYSVVSNHIGRYLLNAKDASGKPVVVAANINNLIVPKDERIIKCHFTYKERPYTEWISDASLTVDKK